MEGATAAAGELKRSPAAVHVRLATDRDERTRKIITVAHLARLSGTDHHSRLPRTGARAVMGRYPNLVCEVEAGDGAPLADIDTPEALDAISR